MHDAPPPLTPTPQARRGNAWGVCLRRLRSRGHCLERRLLRRGHRQERRLRRRGRRLGKPPRTPPGAPWTQPGGPRTPPRKPPWTLPLKPPRSPPTRCQGAPHAVRGRAGRQGACPRALLMLMASTALRLKIYRAPVSLAGVHAGGCGLEDRWRHGLDCFPTHEKGTTCHTATARYKNGI